MAWPIVIAGSTSIACFTPRSHATKASVRGFLREACRGDEPLRRDVESLLTFENDAQAFMEGSAFEIAPALLQPETLTPLIGQRLGPYEVGALLGAGGMGDVYRARDTTLGRDVAIKILPDVFTTDADRRARFEREARLLAALNHPHIGAIYGFEQREGIQGLVLELVEGQTLAERLRAGPLPMREAIDDCAADCGGAGRGARERNCPPRSEAGQHQDHARWSREGPRLRAGESGHRGITDDRGPCRRSQ